MKNPDRIKNPMTAFRAGLVALFIGVVIVFVYPYVGYGFLALGVLWSVAGIYRYRTMIRYLKEHGNYPL
ncbi:hypothetical protein [Jonesia quinghaiensis]|uniref:hypothetical protein n=1 Tax=Jonesia quinghaiensis TaxID=262806 RepID=UPI00040B3A6A|nr:hypothetical protein [Jonesia quinghaiensis]